MATPAFEFRQRLDGVKRLVRLDQSFDGPTPGITLPGRRKSVNELRAACLVLPVAYFEDFLRELVDHFLDRLCSYRPRVPWGKLPDQLRDMILYEYPAVIGDWKKGAVPEPDMRSVLTELASPWTSPDCYTIPSRPIAGMQRNPRARHVKELLKHLGITDLYRKLVPELSSFSAVYASDKQIKLKLDDIVDARNRVAHGSKSISKSRAEIADQIEFLERLANALQQVLQQHLRDQAAKRR